MFLLLSGKARARFNTTFYMYISVNCYTFSEGQWCSGISCTFGWVYPSFLDGKQIKGFLLPFPAYDLRALRISSGWLSRILWSYILHFGVRIMYGFLISPSRRTVIKAPVLSPSYPILINSSLRIQSITTLDAGTSTTTPTESIHSTLEAMNCR
ncbi:hypothetical protein K458DRAFT_35833 [Lentithecium fluviatile CBS 122367]|uniref:Uncharacterized protein n=1 Tax=Lentithecium fluviatile CBS 122367 TaxID=1168545 RepID=A0A6G1J0F8_9PLEO|nr:hypothetical protein K458DRAFT_35833 [Lentithecium fluviatile CBS 122367]